MADFDHLSPGNIEQLMRLRSSFDCSGFSPKRPAGNLVVGDHFDEIRDKWALIFPAIILTLYLSDEFSGMKNVRFGSVSMQDVTVSEFLNETKITDHEKVHYFLGADKA